MRTMLELLGQSRRIRRISDRLRKMLRCAQPNRAECGGLKSYFKLAAQFANFYFEQEKSMLKKVIFGLFLIAAFCVSNAFAQSVYTPEKGSAERTAIFNTLRIPIEKKLKQKVQFVPQTFNVQGNWAFIFGTLQDSKGGEPNYKGTEYQAAIDAGMFDSNFQALLRKQNGNWRVVTYEIGCTDVCWIPWIKEFKAPKAIFPGE
jgi:hypothetical protein